MNFLEYIEILLFLFYWMLVISMGAFILCMSILAYHIYDRIITNRRYKKPYKITQDEYIDLLDGDS
jgi:hypothetical protein